ncbi:MAG: helix-turn-helix domain-containing protein [Candidatus Manganitrophus sp.]|nr:MAG: helix-turn-helix domain-containing protein [Candidatus Manganitrophus sp.]
MKRFSDQNYYEILEIPYRATWGEIQKAYELAKKTYGSDSIASYSLFDQGDRELIFKKIEEAYQTLIDQEKKRKYDESLAQAVEEVAQRIASSAQEVPAAPSQEEALSGEITGKTLKGMRERQGVSLQEIADRTRINLTYLLSIEEDNFRTLPAEVYLRSYIHQYAKMLQWDPNKILEGYLKTYQRWQKEKPSST